MKHRYRLAASAALVLACSATAMAGDLVTPVVYVGATSNVHCKAVNVTTAAVELTDIRMMDANTNLPITSSGAVTIDPGQWGTAQQNNVGAQVYCRFVGANKKKVRASLNANHPESADGSDTTIVVAQ